MLVNLSKQDTLWSIKQKRSTTAFHMAEQGLDLPDRNAVIKAQVPIALALGILLALYRNSWFDRVVNAAALTAISAPEFLLAVPDLDIAGHVGLVDLASTGAAPTRIAVSTDIAAAPKV